MLNDRARQDVINRRYMATEAEHSQTRTVDAGLHFLETNVDADRWLLQIELFEPGTELRAFDTRFGRLAILICNDAWQPFLVSTAVQDGARVLVMPSASSTEVPEAEEYWHDLTRFYARMLQCYVVFVNRVGTEGGFTFWGGSHVVDPLGEPVVEAPRLEEAVVFADLDLERVEARRRELPLLGRAYTLKSTYPGGKTDPR